MTSRIIEILRNQCSVPCAPSLRTESARGLSPSGRTRQRCHCSGLGMRRGPSSRGMSVGRACHQLGALGIQGPVLSSAASMGRRWSLLALCPPVRDGRFDRSELLPSPSLVRSQFVSCLQSLPASVLDLQRASKCSSEQVVFSTGRIRRLVVRISRRCACFMS